ncbi:hypothetical protein N8K70_03905 [Microbacterium betulae]|uniref:Major capsid protein n=1 Tax=Microbacterium betulae TaxID=2981139 RepID=A0AA97I7U6_9MICO|nr:hypothetical protein [Microbacterium sp. AB]WOF23835.1 hypothetical protein N8K70_03905 [Microbacterium sp. AB]
MPTYAPPAPSLDGSKITVEYLLNQPTIVQRLVRDIAAQRLIGGHLLTGRIDMTGSGAAVYEVDNPIMVDEEPEVRDELAEYKLIDDSEAEPSIAQALSRGFASRISDQNISRNRLDVFGRKLRRMSNRAVFQFDSVIMSAIGSAVTQTQAAAGAWNTTGADQFLDLLLAGAVIDELNEGYEANTVVARPAKWARLVGSLAKTFAGAIGTPDIIANGNVLQVAGLTLLKSTHLPANTEVLVLDSTALGSIGFEAVGGGYLGDPSDPLGIETKQFRLEDRDGWQIQVRKNGVPIVQEPRAAVKVTGV